MDYKDWILEMKEKWIGKTIEHEGERYKVVDVDYNGALLIDKKERFTDTTAIAALSAKVVQ